jgi:cell wall-associated NlpC family hydrolase
VPRLAAAAAVAAALAVVPSAFANGVYAEVLAPNGKVVASGSGDSFDFPADGSLVHVGHAEASEDGVTLRDVAAAGYVLQATELRLPAGRDTAMTGIVAAAGRLVRPRPNTLVPLGIGYAVIDQRARARGHIGRVGLRIVLERAAFGQPAGTQVVLGVPTRPIRTVANASREQSGRLNLLAALGFAPGDASLLGFTARPSATFGSVGSRAAAIAQQYLGVPYVWGGASPITGFDCSGLALYVYGRLGISLTHYTGAQFNQGARVAREELQPGDLVFFHDDPARGPQHEGIYIGGGQFVHAPHTGDVVRIASLDDASWGFGYVGAVRPYVQASGA